MTQNLSLLINIYLQTSYDCRPFCHVDILTWGITELGELSFLAVLSFLYYLQMNIMGVNSVLLQWILLF